MHKKAQITIFIVIGLAILIFAALIIYYTTVSEKEEVEIKGIDTAPVQSFVDSCLQQTLDDGIDYISLQGGYYYAPGSYIANLGYTIPYYHDVAEGDLMPSLDEIEKQISFYINDNLNRCLRNFSAFEKIGYNITGGNKNIILNLGESSVSVDMVYPLQIQLGEEIAAIDSFSAQTQTQLKQMYAYARMYINMQKTVPNEEPLGYLMQLAYDNDFRFETMFRYNSYIYAFNTNKTEGKIPYVFVFAVKYDWTNILGSGAVPP